MELFATNAADQLGLAGLVRLPDGRMVLLWNECMRYTYAHGGRHVLHGAISDDDGTSWRGLREVAREHAASRAAAPERGHLGRDPAAGLVASGGGSARRTAGAVRGRRADSSIVSLRSGGSRDFQRPAPADWPRAARRLQRTHSGRPYTPESAVGVGSSGSLSILTEG